MIRALILTFVSALVFVGAFALGELLSSMHVFVDSSSQRSMRADSCPPHSLLQRDLSFTCCAADKALTFFHLMSTVPHDARSQ